MKRLYDIIKLRDTLINSSREELLEYARKYQESLFEALNDKWLPQLHYLSSGSVNKSTANFARIQEIDKLMKTIVAKDGNELYSWFIDRMQKIGVYANEHYNFVNPDNLTNNKRLTDKAVESLLNRIGYDGKSYTHGGFLFDLIQSPDPIRKVKSIAFQSISRGLSFNQFKDTLKIIINGNQGKQGVFETHFRTAAYDAFQQADRQIHNDVAIGLKLNHALYAGTIMTTTRHFCLLRVNKYFTREEIESWSKLTWQGKSTPYDPYIDCGGYNCIHILSWVSKELFDRAKNDNPQAKSDNNTSILKDGYQTLNNKFDLISPDAKKVIYRDQEFKKEDWDFLLENDDEFPIDIILDAQYSKTPGMLRTIPLKDRYPLFYKAISKWSIDSSSLRLKAVSDDPEMIKARKIFHILVENLRVPDKTLYRGTTLKLDGDMSELSKLSGHTFHFGEKSNWGKDIFDLTLQSTTSEVLVSRSFYRNLMVVFENKAGLKGWNIAALSDYHENEVILGDSFKYKVTKIDNGDYNTIFLEQIED